ncbi:MFS general substrate transporter [Ceratobasidium sp. AG-I]|nr:MFS general substrate transporter [Ceratobasidium sp. AG-I]
MSSSSKTNTAPLLYAAADPNIVPAVDAPPVDPEVSTDPFGITAPVGDSTENNSAVPGSSQTTSSERRPWYKTPSVWWLLPITAVSATFRASTIAPRTELFIKFACDELRPEYRVDFADWRNSNGGVGVGSSRVEMDLTYLPFGGQQQKEESRALGEDTPAKAMLQRPDKRCRQDTEVHRAAAKLSAGITSAQGMLSVLTTGWWTQYSDRVGRTRLLGISAAAVLITDLLLFLVAFKADILPGGYRILILGGAIDGLAGGFSAVVAAGHAYVSDCSSPLTRSRIFSFWTGVVYAGAAFGPSFGSLVTYLAGDNLLATFYACTAIHVVYGILVFFFVPESLSVEARTKAKEAYEADMNRRPGTVLGSLWRLTSFVRPLGVFIPKRTNRSRGWRGRDWNITLVGIAAAAVAVNIGSYHFKFQYAIKTFHWSSFQLGNWLSFVGFCRATHLIVILPFILKWLYARRERLLNNAQLSDGEKEAQVKETDLLVVRASLLVDLLGYIFLGSVTDQNAFIFSSAVLSFGGGFAPATQSLALALSYPTAHAARRNAPPGKLPPPARREIGRLFGALAVIQALGSQVAGPALFSATFVATIATYPRAIFWLSSVIIVLALGSLAIVRLDSGAEARPDAPNEEAPLLA